VRQPWCSGVFDGALDSIGDSQLLWLLEIKPTEIYTRQHTKPQEVNNHDNVERSENTALPSLDDSRAGSVYVPGANCNVKLTV